LRRGRSAAAKHPLGIEGASKISASANRSLGRRERATPAAWECKQARPLTSAQDRLRFPVRYATMRGWWQRHTHKGGWPRGIDCGFTRRRSPGSTDRVRPVPALDPHCLTPAPAFGSLPPRPARRQPLAGPERRDRLTPTFVTRFRARGPTGRTHWVGVRNDRRAASGVMTRVPSTHRLVRSSESRFLKTEQ